jgi:hypothetical protein
MILDNIVKMTWVNKNKNHYIKKGYVFTKIFDVFEVKIEDVSKGCDKEILVKCDVCGNERYLSYRKYDNNIMKGGYYACSPKCCKNKSKQTCLKKYGVEYYIQSDIGKERYENTCLKIYGFKNISKNDEIKQKKIQTCLKNYGTEHPSQSEKVQEKSKQTCLKKYGVEHPWLNKDVKKKVDDTMLKKFGTKIATKNVDVMNKIIQTQIDKYGEIWRSHVPSYNVNSIIYLDIISKELNIPIQHALNGGEKKIIKYWIDGYIEKYNICIEWDESQHKNKNNIKKDKNREKYLIENYGCVFIRINELMFLRNVEDSILNIVNNINNTINQKNV